MTDLYRHSISVIRRNQAPSGAYLASPAFSQYGYCWLRDGSFTAYAMDRAQQHDSSAAFFRWVHSTLQRHATKAERCLSLPPEELQPDDYLHTRYTVEGEEVATNWWNFQLDGYGTWLWALQEHVQRTGDTALAAQVYPSAELSTRYLAALWQRPNYDWWEEHGDKVNVATLAAVYGGLKAAAELYGGLPGSEAADDVRRFVLARCVGNGRLVKYLGTEAVDASLLAAATPFRLLEPDDPIMQTTAAQIVQDLDCDGGVHRYLLDTYYGGGEWTLLSAWLGWYLAERGQREEAVRYLAWVEAQADAAGDLPEQVTAHLLFPDCYAEWEARWGPIAKPLVWSHAMYVILACELGDSGFEI